jgi:hypothetical protein
MSEKKLGENPNVSDKIVFELETPNTSGSLVSNPYEVSKLVIYFVSRDYSSGNLRKYKDKKEEDKHHTEFYFREAEPVAIIGNENYPAWLSTDLENAIIENTEPCKFKYIWEPTGVREGDYFICWTWKPLAAGDSLSDQKRFYLESDTQTTTSLPSHHTKANKYETLLDRYLPEMFKAYISSSDVSPDVLSRTNKSIASGFRSLEDLANQLVDLQDANSLHEFLLPYLSNYFGLKLKSDDPTRWRGQIKRAIPLYKKKGTRGALSEALGHIGAKLEGLTQLWQVISSKTWQESFTFDGKNGEFSLEKNPILPIDSSNFEFWFRSRQSAEWDRINETNFEFYTEEEIAKFSWIGNTSLLEGDEVRVIYKYQEISSSNEQDLEDYIRMLPLMDVRDSKSIVKAKVKSGSNIISGLPLSSEFRIGDKLFCPEFTDVAQIVEIINFSTVRVSSVATSTNNNTFVAFKGFENPPKNWNVRTLREDDPMFNRLISERNPFFDPLVFGKIRTEFPYSENVYHMDEYNGSIRDSLNPCDIDKAFVDPCYSCISSSYDIDVEVEQISDEKIEEVKNTIIENTPFHAVMHTCNFIGGINEFVEPSQENLEMLVTYVGSDFVVAGHAQNYFYRIMLNFPTQGLKRSDLADEESVYVGSGTCSNESVLVFCPDVVLSSAGVAPNENSFIEIKSPSSLSGDYVVELSEGNTLKITDPASFEPIDQIDSPFDEGVLSSSAFTFDLNNKVEPIDSSLCNILQDGVFYITDEDYEFSAGVEEKQIKTLTDVENGTASYAWDIELSYGTFPVKDIINGKLVLGYDFSLPSSNTTSEAWTLKDNGVSVSSSSKGKIFVEKRAIVTSLDSSCHPIKEILFRDNYYQKVDQTEYHVSGIVEGTNNKYYLRGYDKGDMNGVTIDMREKIVKEKIGYLSYKGLKLESGATESVLGIQNGDSYSGGELLENNYFKESFIVVINDMAYWIHEINDDTMVLSGSPQYFGVSGSSVNFEIFRYSKKGATIIGQKNYLPTHTFPDLDRNGRAIITSTVEEKGSSSSTVTGLSEDGKIEDLINQEEEVSFTVEYKKEENHE